MDWLRNNYDKAILAAACLLLLAVLCLGHCPRPNVPGAIRRPGQLSA